MVYEYDFGFGTERDGFLSNEAVFYLYRVCWERDANVESLNGILGDLVLLFLIKRVLLEIAIHCPLDLEQY